MVKFTDLEKSSWRRSKNAIVRIKVLEQLQEKRVRDLENSLRQHVKTIDSKSDTIQEEMFRLCSGMKIYKSYNVKENTADGSDTIVYPLVRTSRDWEPKTCWTRTLGGSETCLHFPCRTFTSYHFISRELPKFVEDAAEKSVRRSRYEIDTGISATNDDDDNELEQDRKEDMLPPIYFTENMTMKEWKLKMLIAKKRLDNKLKNKPKDRNMNYGSPTPVRQLQKPVRPVVRRVYTTLV